CQPSSNATATCGSNLPEAFVNAPRPRDRDKPTPALTSKSRRGSALASGIPPAGSPCPPSPACWGGQGGGSGPGGRRRTEAWRNMDCCKAQNDEQNKNKIARGPVGTASDLFTHRSFVRRAQFSCLRNAV